MKKFRLETVSINMLISEFVLNIPDFQRRFVWNSEKKLKLVDSLQLGFPIGAITLFERENDYLIIDGLQRINTLIQFSSTPNEILQFNYYYKIIEPRLSQLFQKHNIKYNANKQKRNIKNWYESLKDKFDYQKISLLKEKYYEDGLVEKDIEIYFLEDLHEILKEPISFEKQEVAVIIYRGDIDTIPQLFSNINTATKPLSKYEMFQAIWYNYKLNNEMFNDYYRYYEMQLESVNSDYQISSTKEAGDYDIFKNLIALSNKLCCNEDMNKLFSLWVPSSKQLKYEDLTRYYENDEIAFEIFSTIVTSTPNAINTSINRLFESDSDYEKISKFVLLINNIIYDECINVITSLKKLVYKEKNFSKYHSLYVLIGFIKSKYYIDNKNFIVFKKEVVNQRMIDEVLKIEEHLNEEWFINENRQISFLVSKLKLLDDLD